MKAIIKRRFVPIHYYQELYQKLQNLTQSFKSVKHHYNKMKVVII